MSRKRLVEARSPEYENLGKKIAQCREAMDLSQAEAAKLIGIPQEIANAYNVTVDYLIGTGPVVSGFNTLLETEKDLVIKYRAASPAIKEAVIKLLE